MPRRVRARRAWLWSGAGFGLLLLGVAYLLSQRERWDSWRARLQMARLWRDAVNKHGGDVTVIQQPTARNGYTTVIRVEDRSGGYGRYDFDLRWY